MRGTDLTEWQLKAAEKFLRKDGSTVGHDQDVCLRFSELVRIVAWYGQIRAKAVESGAPADEPGEVYVVSAASVTSQPCTFEYSSPENKAGKLLAITRP